MAVVKLSFRVRPPLPNSRTKRFPLVGFPSRAARLPNSEVPAGSRERHVLRHSLRSLIVRVGQKLAGYARCRPSKNSEPDGAANGRFAPEGARSVVVDSIGQCNTLCFN